METAIYTSLKELVESPNAKKNAMWDRARGALAGAKTQRNAHAGLVEAARTVAAEVECYCCDEGVAAHGPCGRCELAHALEAIDGKAPVQTDNYPDVAGLIAEMLDGKEWSVETLDEIADVLREAGYQVRDVDYDADDDDANEEMGLPSGEDWGNK